jgi:crotonobetainyl-CoA:carnitine CoA-transferase CaiB-like acyl-CoA transferase
MKGPLDGIRVIDLTSMISGPIATMLLADQGADVIKVEPPAGDLVRVMGAGKHGVSATFLSANRNKRSVVLDLKTARGLDLLKQLVATADVFVQNFRPGAVARMGLSESALRAIKPDLIYVSISGFGETGPYSHKRVYDPVIQALSGLAAIQADRDTGRPRMVRTIVPDKLTAITASQAITAALFARERGSGGQHVKLSMLDTMVAFLWPEGLAQLTFPGGENSKPRGQLAQDLVFETADGYMTAGAVSDAEWQGMCEAFNKPEWLHDERFNSAHKRVVNAAQRLEATQAVLRTQTTDYWLTLLDEKEVPCAPIVGRENLLQHPQVIENAIVETLLHPIVGEVRQPRPAAQFSDTPAAIQSHAPELGQHSDELMLELGLDSAEIATLHQQGIVHGASHSAD